VGLREAPERRSAELGRRAARIGVARLAKALADPDHRLALAALDSVPYLPDRLLLLDAVLAQCDSPDTQLGERALRTVACCSVTRFKSSRRGKYRRGCGRACRFWPLRLAGRIVQLSCA